MVVAGAGREDGCAGLVGAQHVLQVNFIERGFTGYEDKRPSFFERDVSGTMDEVVARSAGDISQSCHAAWADDHTMMLPGPAGRRGTYVAYGV